MTRKQKRLSIIGGFGLLLTAATTMTFYTLGQKTSFFYTPAETVSASLSPGQRIRLGGLVGEGSLRRDQGPQV